MTPPDATSPAQPAMSAPPPVRRPTTARHRLVAALCAATVALGMTITAPPAAAETVNCSPETWADLESAFGNCDAVTLGDDIEASAGESLAVPDSGDVTLDLAGQSLTVTAPAQFAAAIAVPGGATLAIEDSSAGSGKLTAIGGLQGAGIGGGNLVAAGTIEIAGGTITATGGFNAAGIGGGAQSAAGTITITGGDITANGSPFGAGIGGGNFGAAGTIEIAGGTITATAGFGAAGIGGGAQSAAGTITITGGDITANGSALGAGIGGGGYSAVGTIEITGGNVTATSGVAADSNGAAGIGGGYQNDPGTIVIGSVDGPAPVRVTARGAPDASAIGRGSGGAWIPVTVERTGVLTVESPLTGDGTIDNRGVIRIGDGGSVDGGGTGDGESALRVTGHNYLLEFDPGEEPAPDTLRVFAPTIAAAGHTLPSTANPPWRLGETCAAAVDEDTDLPALLGPGPTTRTLYIPEDHATCTVTFDAGAGGAVLEQHVAHGDPVAVPDDPAATGKAFAGWFTAETGGEEWDFTTGAVTSDLTLYAHYSVAAPTFGDVTRTAGGFTVDIANHHSEFTYSVATDSGSVDRSDEKIVVSGLDAGASATVTVTSTLAAQSVSADVTGAAKASQTVTFTSAAPAYAAVGGSYAPTAEGGASGNPVTFAVEAASAAVCHLDGGTATFTAVGDCAITASQDGDDDHLPASATQSFTVGTVPEFAPLPALTFESGKASSMTITVIGAEWPAITLSGALPYGIAFTDHGDGTATIGGTSTQAGTYPVTLSASNARGTTTVGATVTVTAAPLPPSAPPADPTPGAPDAGDTDATPTPPAPPNWQRLRPVSIDKDGEDIPGVWERTGDGLTVTSGTLRWEVTTMHAGRPVPPTITGALLVPRGGSVRTAVTGFRPGSLVRVWVFSSPTFLGEFLVGASSSGSAEFTLPSALPAGDHTLLVEGVGAGGEALSMTIRLVVTEPTGKTTEARDPAPTTDWVTSAGPTARLASTGVDPATGAAIAALLLGAGIAFTRIGSTRRRCPVRR